MAAHQQQIRESQPVQQTTLFDVAPARCDPDKIDPFSQNLCPMSFDCLPADSSSEAFIYFVIDTAAQLAPVRRGDVPLR